MPLLLNGALAVAKELHAAKPFHPIVAFDAIIEPSLRSKDPSP
jgi:hypothetical protein